MVDVLFIIVAGGAVLFLVSLGGLISSLLNRRKLHQIGLDVQHARKNQKMIAEIVERRLAAQQAPAPSVEVVIERGKPGGSPPGIG